MLLPAGSMTSADQPPKGPYLGNIAQTYKRPELAQNILEPSKTIAQGFAKSCAAPGTAPSRER